MERKRKNASLEKRDPREAGSALMNGRGGERVQGSHTSLTRQPIVSMGDMEYKVGVRNATVLFNAHRKNGDCRT